MSLTPFRVNRVSPPEDEWMRRDAEANAAAFYYHQQQSAEEYVLTDDEVMYWKMQCKVPKLRD